MDFFQLAVHVAVVAGMDQREGADICQVFLRQFKGDALWKLPSCCSPGISGPPSLRVTLRSRFLPHTACICRVQPPARPMSLLHEPPPHRFLNTPHIGGVCPQQFRIHREIQSLAPGKHGFKCSYLSHTLSPIPLTLTMTASAFFMHALKFISYCSHGCIPRGVFVRFLHENPELHGAKLRFCSFCASRSVLLFTSCCILAWCEQ